MSSNLFELDDYDYVADSKGVGRCLYEAQEGFSAGEIKQITIHREETLHYNRRLKKYTDPKYVVTPSRSSNPYDPKILRQLIETQSYSEYLNRHILNTEDALSHTSLMTEQWLREDEANEVEQRRLKNNERQRLFQERKRKQAIPPEVAAAKSAWKAAIAQRNEAMAQWDTYIAHLNKAYLTLKLDSANKEAQDA